MKRRLGLVLSVVLLAGLVAAPAGARNARSAAADATDNVKRIAHFPYENKEKDFFAGGTDIDFSGKYVYAMQQGKNGGVHIFDNSGPKPKKVSYFHCPGEQNDIAVVKPGLIALGYHSSQCGAPGAGVLLIDVKNAKRPKLLGRVETPSGTHTLTVYPGKPVIYASPGGLANGGGTEQIIDVSNPKAPKIKATFSPNGPIGCHDLTFYVTKDSKIAGCAGAGEAQLWDVSDPFAPTTISHLAVPAQFPHSFAFTHDGKYAVVGDEAIGGNDCVGGPTGSLWVYNIEVREAPVLMGHWGPQRGPQPAGSSFVDRNIWCSAHLFNFVPGTYTLVASWYAGGMSVIDFTNPTVPVETAHYMGTDEITNYWSAYWYDGKIWANDRTRGLDVFTVKGLKEGKHHH